MLPHVAARTQPVTLIAPERTNPMNASNTLLAAAISGILVGMTACGGSSAPAEAPATPPPADSPAAEAPAQATHAEATNAPAANAPAADAPAADATPAGASHGCSGKDGCKGN
jgi:hypothetical protein